MSTRFNSRKNKPNSNSLEPKRKILREFHKLRDKIESMNYNEGLFEAGDPTIVASLFDGTSKLGVSSPIRLIPHLYRVNLTQPMLRVNPSGTHRTSTRKSVILSKVWQSASNPSIFHVSMTGAGWARQVINSITVSRRDLDMHRRSSMASTKTTIQHSHHSCRHLSTHVPQASSHSISKRRDRPCRSTGLTSPGSVTSTISHHHRQRPSTPSISRLKASLLAKMR